MKKLKFIGLFALSMSVFACGGGESPEAGSEAVETASAEVDYKGMEWTDLTEFGVNASLQIPNGDKGPQRIQNSATESVEIIVGTSYGIEVIPFGLTVEEKKAGLDGDLVYTIEYLEDTPDKVVYKKTIKDTDVEPEFHFLLMKEIDGESYSIQSLNKAYKQRWIEKMVISAESLTANKPL